MTERKYPRIGIVYPNRRGQCVICRARAAYEVHVQYTCMRGDDSVFRVCRVHYDASVDALHATVKEVPRG